MALIRMDHVPETVKVSLPLYILLPDPGSMLGVPVRQRKLLYLLHGLSDDGSAWQRYTSIEPVASAYGMVVVMPSAGRSFYTDQPNGQRYFSYLVDELPKYLADVFGLEPKREDTLVAGNSMGGYGAFKWAFHSPERFAAAASFSGALSLAFVKANPNDPRIPEFSQLFGDLNKLSGSVHDPVTWFLHGSQDRSRLPRLYMSCGRQDDLYPINRQARAALKALGIEVDYYEEDAGHEWSFWDVQIRRFLFSVLGPPPAVESRKNHAGQDNT